jgi:hypothetical protein
VRPLRLCEELKWAADAGEQPLPEKSLVKRFAPPGRFADPFKRLNDILPINNALLKSRSITATIHCVHKASQ